MRKPLKQGQQVFTAGWGCPLNQDKIEVHRQFVLACEPGRFELGESLRRESMTFSSPRLDGEREHLHDTPEKAVDYALDWEIELAKQRVESLKKELAEARERITELKKYDRSKFKVRKYPEDWVPCDY